MSVVPTEVFVTPEARDEHRRRFSTETVNVAAVWFGSRIAVFIAGVYATWAFAGKDPLQQFGSDPELTPPLGPIASWYQWDVAHYVAIARDWYATPGDVTSFAFLPGFPSLLWAFGKANIHPALAGLIISIIGGFIAALALARLTCSVGGRGDLGVLAWVLAPTAVFLAAPYPEAVFCAFAFWAWTRAKDGDWLGASVLAAAASAIRINGVFLAVALVVLFLTSERRRWRAAPLLVLPFVAILAVFAWYRAIAGTWSAWFDAQRIGWGRELTNPIDALHTTFDHAFAIGQTATFSVQYKMELAAMIIIVALGIVMLLRRWWGEATYVLLTAISLGTSTLYFSVPRSALVLFPVWMLFGVWMSRFRSVLLGYVVLAAPLMFISVAGYINGRWIA